MFLKKNRLTKKEFLKVFKKGERSVGQDFTIVWSIEGGDTPKISVVCSRKTLKKAVWRNKQKRRIIACLYSFKEELPGGIKIIIICKKDLSNTPHKTLCNDLIGRIKQTTIT